MTYNDVVTEYKKEILNIADKLKKEINLFYDKNKDSNNFLDVYTDFKNTFDEDIISFNNKYNMSCPKILIGTPYSLFVVRYSIEVYLDLNRHYDSILEKIQSKFPNLDGSLEIQD